MDYSDIKQVIRQMGGIMKGESMKVFIDGKETNLNALNFLKFALDTKTGKQKPLKEISK